MKNNRRYTSLSLHVSSKLSKSREVKFIIAICENPEPSLPYPKIDGPFPVYPSPKLSSHYHRGIETIFNSCNF